MKDKIFVDTNIWLYAFMEQEDKKQVISKEIIELNAENICLSVQVLNEICINLLKKANYLKIEIKQLINRLNDTFDIFPLTVEDSVNASNLREKYNLSFWDSLIVASALNHNCQILYSEDMQHNQIIEDKLKVINPFEGK